ncbi:aspartate aminotransferase family protein [Dasania marina]|uniref:aspartate aminotransferase family protein n=1 Tax=Dasania marina TaxID=471499 RepID=UPI0030DC727F|tara:strand:- start:105473 stop:106762 length:1290 start_codon:yes stop_codon:yes gene_type:complete
MNNTEKNAELLERRYRLIGKKAPLFYDQPIHIVKGEGVWLHDADGKRYLDVYNNVPNVGHCHPHVVEAISKQAAQLNIHTRYLHENILNYGEKLTGLLDESLSMLFLTCTGSEANEVALRMARHHTGKQGIICSNATYHGNTTAVDALATLFNDGKPNGPYVKAVDFPDSYRPLNGLSGDALTDAYMQQIKDTIAAFNEEGTGFAGMLICPIFANEGLPDLPPNYLQKAAALVREAGGLVIFDEVQSSFGRTGKMWGHQHSGVTPDILTLGKPMGNGHPLAGAICSPELGNAYREDVMYFNTFGGNPVSCAAGLAVLEVIEQENLVANSLQVGQYIKAGLQKLAATQALIGDVRGSGLFFGIELVLDQQSKTPATAEAARISNIMKEQGVLISKIGRHDNILKMRPPICFSQEHADILLSNLAQAFAKL